MDVGRHNQTAFVLLAVFIAIPQDFGRQHFKTTFPDIVHLDLNFVFVNNKLYRHTITPLRKGNFPMVQGVRIVPQFVHTDDGIFFIPHDDPHITKVVVRRL